MACYGDDPLEMCAAPDLDQEGKSVPVYVLDDQHRVERFLIIGTEGGTYYATESHLVQLMQNASSVTNLIEAGQGELVVKKVIEVCRKGQVAKRNCALFALALCCCSKDKTCKKAAYEAVCNVCEIPTDLFQFVQYMESLSKSQRSSTGWGRGLRKAVSVWYNQLAGNPHRLAMLVTKYRQRDGWSHRDLLRLSHTKPSNSVIGFILCYAANGLPSAQKQYMEDPIADADQQMKDIATYLADFNAMKELNDPSNWDSVCRVISLIKKHDFVREHIPTSMLNSAAVWASLLEKMPLNAMIRNLAKMTAVGALNDASKSNVDKVIEKLGNGDALRRSGVHPYSILVAWITYNYGHGHKGRLAWKPVPALLTALEEAFYKAFANVAPTQKRILIALDVSDAMAWTSPGLVASPRILSAAMMMLTLRRDPCCQVVAFSTRLLPLDIKKDWGLGQVISYIETIPTGHTDCSLPMLWAKEQEKQYDAFIIYTDSETWWSATQPAKALRQYREASGIQNAKLATVAMTSGNFSLADPADLNMMDVVGFNSETPLILQEFIEGKLYE